MSVCRSLLWLALHHNFLFPGNKSLLFFFVFCQEEWHSRQHSHLLRVRKKSMPCLLASSPVTKRAWFEVCGIPVYDVLSSGRLEWTGFIHPSFSSSLIFSVQLIWGLRMSRGTLEICVSHSCSIVMFFISTVEIHCPRYKHWLAGRKCAGPVFVAKRHTECQGSEGSVPYCSMIPSQRISWLWRSSPLKQWCAVCILSVWMLLWMPCVFFHKLKGSCSFIRTYLPFIL